MTDGGAGGSKNVLELTFGWEGLVGAELDQVEVKDSLSHQLMLGYSCAGSHTLSLGPGGQQGA